MFVISSKIMNDCRTKGYELVLYFSSQTSWLTCRTFNLKIYLHQTPCLDMNQTSILSYLIKIELGCLFRKVSPRLKYWIHKYKVWNCLQQKFHKSNPLGYCIFHFIILLEFNTTTKGGEMFFVIPVEDLPILIVRSIDLVVLAGWFLQTNFVCSYMELN